MGRKKKTEVKRGPLPAMQHRQLVDAIRRGRSLNAEIDKSLYEIQQIIGPYLINEEVAMDFATDFVFSARDSIQQCIERIGIEQ
jgi:hypothetical protein